MDLIKLCDNECRSSPFDVNDALKRVNLTQEDLRKLRKLTENDDTVPKKLKDCFYCVFHAGATTEEAFEKIKLYFQLKKQSPEVFRYRNPYSEEIRRCFEHQNYCLLPVTPQGYHVFIGNLRDTDVSTFVFNSIAKAQYMSIENCFYSQGPQKGIILIVDMKGGKLMHLTKIRLKTIQTSMKMALDATPTKIVAIHILNAVPFFNVIAKIIMPFSRKELKDKLHLHYDDMDWDDFYQNHVPRSCLPSNYGGDLESLQVLSQKNLESWKKHKSYFRYDEELIFGDEGDDEEALRHSDDEDSDESVDEGE